MNIKKSALYLVGGLYFLLFSAACVCHSPGSGSVQVSEGQKPAQQAPVEYSAATPAAGEEIVVEENTTEMPSEGTVIEESTTEISGNEGTVIEESTTEVISGDEGTVVEESTTSIPMEGTPADGTPVSE